MPRQKSAIRRRPLKEEKKRDYSVPRKNRLCVSIAPTNIIQQQTAFFKSNFDKNPIFEYQEGSDQQSYISRFEPSSEFLKEAECILDTCLEQYGSETAYLEQDGGHLLSKEETLAEFSCYLEKMNLSEVVNIVFSQTAIAPTAVRHNPKTGISQVTIAEPIVHRKNRIRGVMHHEIGTHLVRTMNEKLQVWHKKRNQFKLKGYIETEEGLASLNTNIEAAWTTGRKPLLWRSALHYYSSYMASQMSFVELFNHLEKYIDDPVKRFKEVSRVKRGLKDTGEPGGCYKDQVYLAGAIRILRSRHLIDFQKFFMGKLSLEDYFRPEIQKRIKCEGGTLPVFLEDMPKYLSALDEIARTNGISN